MLAIYESHGVSCSMFSKGYHLFSKCLEGLQEKPAELRQQAWQLSLAWWLYSSWPHWTRRQEFQQDPKGTGIVVLLMSASLSQRQSNICFARWESGFLRGRAGPSTLSLNLPTSVSPVSAGRSFFCPGYRVEDCSACDNCM